ncbi:unnamed protein product [Paramecium sonneborni]|uniref:EF-hand domain-containing protein n=1 Tax=Paramecium sonneborni TaxID=65129 RepID=A0A8S1RKI8_9CILI|nr:unnamed protein product [Paramecium sonneborni]
MSMINSESQPIAIVSLQMEDGVEEIKVYEGEDVELEVELFCQRYKLGNDCLEYLVNQIKQQLKREPSPRFGDFNKQRYLSKGSLQTRSSKQSDFGLITSASSDENQISAQKSYEEWQKKINKKVEANSNSKFQLYGQSSNSLNNQNNSSAINKNDRIYGEATTLKQNRFEKQKQQQPQNSFKPNISPNTRYVQQYIKKPEDGSFCKIGHQFYQKEMGQNQKTQQQILQAQKDQTQMRSFQPRRSDITSRNHSEHNRSSSYTKNRSNTPVNEKSQGQEKQGKQKKFDQLKQEFKKIYSINPQIINLYKKQENLKESSQQKVKKFFTDQFEKKKRIEQKQPEKSIQNNSTFENQIIKDQVYQQATKNQDFENQKQIQLKQNNRSTSNLSHRSDSGQLINITKINQFDHNIKKIFRQLDGDKDGFISKDKLNLSGIEVQLLELVSEALYKIEEEDIIADQNQFKKICQSMGLSEKLKNQKI